jgi:hypothetical protein
MSTEKSPELDLRPVAPQLVREGSLAALLEWQAMARRVLGQPARRSLTYHSLTFGTYGKSGDEYHWYLLPT